MQLVGDNLELYAMPPQEREKRKRELNLLETLERLRITTETQLPPQQFLFRMLDKPCFPRGELVTVTGKAKSGKTFFLSLLMGMGCLQHAASRKSPALGIERIPDAPLKVLWFDTEQSRHSTLEILKDRIVRMVSDFPSELFDVFNTRSMRWNEREQLLLTAIAHSRPDLVILDGICDLVADINDGTIVKPVVEQLMATAQEYDCCIVCAIHQNKAADDRNPRGWMGTELNNKSFEIYSCELLKPQIIFSVEQTNSRRYRWDGNYYFLVDEQGMPHQADVPATTAGTADGKPQKESYPPMNAKYASWQDGHVKVDIRNLFCDVLKNGARYYSDLQATAMQLLGCKDTGFWNHLFNQAKKEGVITDGYNSDNRRIWKLQQKVTAQDLPFTKDENSDAPPF